MMKKILFILLAMVVIVGCKKDDTKPSVNQQGAQHTISIPNSNTDTSDTQQDNPQD